MTEIDADLAKALSEENGSWRMVAARHALTIMRLRAALKETSELAIRIYDAGHLGSTTLNDDAIIDRARKFVDEQSDKAT